MKKIVFIITLSSLNILCSAAAEKQAPLLETPGNPNNSDVTSMETKHWAEGVSQIIYQQPQPNGNVLVAQWDYQDSGNGYKSYLTQNVGGTNYQLGHARFDDKETFDKLQHLYGNPELDVQSKRSDCLSDLCGCFFWCANYKK